jgi:WD40 repeat protein
VTASAPGNPFPGLRPFERSQSDLFFGRRAPTNELVARLADHAFVAVVGASGSGKSSLVRCGVLADLRSGYVRDAGLGWRVAIMQPGRAAIEALAAALAAPSVFGSQNGHDPLVRRRVFETLLRETPGDAGLVEIARSRLSPDENLLIVVDQFEELFRYREAIDEADLEAHAFVDLMLRARRHTEEYLRSARRGIESGRETARSTPDREPRVYVILTMRAEFLGECMLFRGLPEAINESVFLVPHMTKDEQREVIERPVKRRQVEIAPALVDHILADVGNNLDQLPVLQHALMRTWNHWAERRTGAEPIDVRDYVAIGGMQALDRHAGETYLALDEAQRRIARRMFQCLTRVDDNGRRLRRPAQLKEICAVTGANKAAVVEVVDAFRRPGREFLTLRDPEEPDAENRVSEPTAETLIDISHESLIRKWVGEWEGMETAGLKGEGLKRWVEEEARSARSFETLATAAEDNGGRVGLLGRNFMDTRFRTTREWMRTEKPSPQRVARYEREPGEFEAAKRFYHRAVAMWALRWALGVAVVAGICGFFVLRAQLADRDRAVAMAASADDPLLGARLLGPLEDAPWLTRAVGQQEPADGEAAAWQLILAGIPRSAWSANVDHAAFSPDGRFLVAASDDGSVTRWSVGAEAGLAGPFVVWSNEGVQPINVQYAVSGGASGGDTTIVALFADGTIRRWSHDGSQLLGEVPTGITDRQATVFSPDGAELALVGSSNAVLVWGTDGAGPDTLVRGDGALPSRVAFSSDGGMLATLTPYVPELPSDQLQSRRAVSVTCIVRAFARDAAGTWAVTDTLAVDGCGSNAETGLAVQDSGRRIAFGETSGVTQLWTVGETTVRRLEGHAAEVWDVAFAGASRLATASEDRTARLWDADSGAARALLTGHEGGVRKVKFDPGGTRLLTTSDDGTARTWDARSGLPVFALRGHRGNVEAHFDGDGSEIVTIGAEGDMRLWSTRGTVWGDSLERLAPAELVALGLRDDRLLAAAGTTVVVWGPSWRSNEPERDTVISYSDYVSGVGFSPDGRSALVAAGDSAYLYDRAWTRTARPLGLKSLTAIAFAGDTSILVGFSDGKAALWAAAGDRGDREFHLADTIRTEGTGRVIDIAVGQSDGADVVAIAKGDTVWIYRRLMADDRPRRVVHRHLTSVALGPDAERLATASDDGAIRLWDLTKPDPIQVEPFAEWVAHRERVLDLAFTADGSHLVSTSDGDAMVRIWPLEWDGLVSAVRRASGPSAAVHGPLTLEERLGR